MLLYYRPHRYVYLEMRSTVTDVPRSVCLLNTAVSCTRTAEPIEVPFRMKSGVGLGNHALGGGQDLPHWKGRFSGT